MHRKPARHRLSCSQSGGPRTGPPRVKPEVRWNRKRYRRIGTHTQTYTHVPEAQRPESVPEFSSQEKLQDPKGRPGDHGSCYQNRSEAVTGNKQILLPPAAWFLLPVRVQREPRVSKHEDDPVLEQQS